MEDNTTTIPSFRREKYQWLRSHTSLDLMDIDDHVMELPVLIQEAGECVALANEARERAKDDLEQTRASLAHSLRSDSTSKRSETRIEAELPIYEQYQDAMRRLSAARLDASLWATIVDALRVKSMSVRVAADLLNSGFLTPSYIRDKRRKEIREVIPK